MRKVIFFLVLLALSTTIVSAQQFDLVLEGGHVMDPETGVNAVRLCVSPPTDQVQRRRSDILDLQSATLP